MKSLKKQNKRLCKNQTERILGAIALLTILAAGVIGFQLENAEIEPYLVQSYPEAADFEQINSDIYAAYDAQAELLGYVAMGEANGYGGPLRMAVGVDMSGEVIGMALVKHRETPSWMARVLDSGYMDDLLGKTYQDAFILGEDVDGITSATYSSRAIANAVMQASRDVAEFQLGLEVPPQEKVKIKFGIPEITLLGLYALGYIGQKGKFKYSKQLRWVCLITGMVVIGFIYNSPLTLAFINKLLMGFWPQWQTNLYWYILIGGILFVFTVDNKNPYCQWFCPFGAAQECLGAIGGAKALSPGKHRGWMRWTRRCLVWFAIVVALLTRSPGLTSYEIFGTLFSLVGNNIQFILLGIILIASLFIKRPWCTYLCPLAPVDKFIRMARKWVLEQWRKILPKIRKTTSN